MPRDYQGDDAAPRAPMENATQSALEAGRLLALTAQDSPLKHGKPYVIIRGPDGSEAVEYVDAQFSRPPEGKSGTAKVLDLPSFLAYWKDHGRLVSRVYASLKPVQFVAVLDDYYPCALADVDDGADWREHRLSFTPEHSREWNTWVGRSGKDKAFDGNSDFAAWLEDQLPDVVEPDGATLLQIARTFRVSEGVTWNNEVRLTDGTINLLYHREITGAAGPAHELKIPEIIKISIPVWAGVNQKNWTVEARFRYRLTGSKLSIWYELIRPHKVVEAAFLEMWNEITTATGRAPLLGSPDL